MPKWEKAEVTWPEATCSSRNADLDEPAVRAVVEVLEERGQAVGQLGKRPGRVQNRLIVRDVVGSRAHLGEIERPDLGLLKDIELAEGREDAGPISARVASPQHDP